MTTKPTVIVAGIGGASLGTEVLKCLRHSGAWNVVGCDVSPFAFGHYAGLASATAVVNADDYASSVLALAKRAGAIAVVPGAGAPLKLLNESRNDFSNAGVIVVGNSARTVALADDKSAVAAAFDAAGVAQPRWVAPTSAGDGIIETIDPPYVVKPVSGAGGSRFVFLAEDRSSAEIYVEYLTRNGMRPMVQEYIPEDEGEFSVGALNRSDGSWVGAIVMRRIFPNELSVRHRSKAGLISSAYGQGRFGSFPKIIATARMIAEVLGSTGPLNIQGRMREGMFRPFEVNARFSGSCYLRALAGFNEIDLALKDQALGEEVAMPAVRECWALRGLTETLVDDDALK